MAMVKEPNGWFERHVTEALERIEGKVNDLDMKLDQKCIDDAMKIAKLEEKTSARATFFGAVAGAVAGLLGWVR